MLPCTTPLLPDLKPKGMVPEELNILGITIKVINEPILEKDEVYGDWDGTKLTIRVDSTGTQEQQFVTLLHEIAHVWDDFCHMRLSHQNVYLVSQLIFMLFKENPKLVDMLTTK